MALFQKSVQNDYLNRVQDSSIKEYWEYYDSYFNNPEKQKLIEQQKERKFYSEFIDELFVNCLGYTKKIGESQNYFIEEKNETDSGKADGAVKVNGEVVAVMEFKDTTTKNLKDVESQAFGYKNTHPKCNYIVTCNFKELWFYIGDTTSKEPFDLFNLSYDSFKLLWLCLSYESISTNLPEQIKNESVTKEEKISKELYIDYSLFRNEIFNDLVNKNPQFDKLLLFKKTQKLLDRFLFIFFAEDRLLLPTNSIAKIIKKWEDDIAFGEEKSLYTTFVFYFNLLNKGRPASKEREEIFAYNGGLFAPDEMLDTIVIDDELLSKHTKKLSSYDFISDVSVNILGHIFEHSLSQIEEIQNEIAGIETDKSKSKRKKDGVFYTPAYITKYIVENTVGKLCKEKREELEFNEAEFVKDRKGRQKNTLKKLSNQLDNYREWLLGITICDPACGSGAFLVEALNFLIDEHNYIDELRASVFGESIQFSDITASILENNLYGVDINEESVEIAKLSLWLRTAQKGRKLTSLSDNLKCGNSLIDDPEVAGDKAFNWENEFPEVFGNGGFDVIIGNPPYVRVQSLKENYFSQTEFLEKTYVSATGKYDLYAIFMESSYNLINQFGLVSFILPHKFLVADFGNGIRKFLSKNKAVESIVHFGSDIVFNDASTYTCIVNLQKKADELKFVKIKPLKITNSFKFNSIDYSCLSNEAWLLKDKTEISLFDKVTKGKSLENMCEGIYQGLITTGDDIFMVEGEIEDKIFKGYSKALASNIELEAGLLKEVLKGQDIKRYLPLRSNRYVIYPHKLNSSNKTVAIEEDNFENLYPKTFNYLLNFKEHLVEKKIRYKTNPKYWYSLHRPREISLFEQDYLITPQLQNYPSFTVKETNVYADAGGYLLLPNKIYNSLELLPILNSKLLWYFIKNTSSEYGGGYFYFKTKYLEPFCIPTQRLDEFDFKDVVSSQLNKTQALFSQVHKFQRTLQRKFEGLDKLPKKLENWYQLTFTDFVKELKKKKIKLSLTKEAEWEDYFLVEQQKAIEIKTKIDQIDKEIDQMVYELYGLTQEEIEIVENATK